jgi:4-hydroxy-tetrahydrodipicolinate synthase
MFRGAIVALVTPFREGRLDEKALCDIIERCLAAGVSGFVPCGSTGESATLSHAEHKRVVELTVEAVNRRAKVIAGTGSNATAEAIDLTRHAKSVGADGALLISPYYNKPTQEGIFLHYEAVARAVDLPILVYNIPGRTASNVLPQTLARLAGIENIVGVKEAAATSADRRVVRPCGRVRARGRRRAYAPIAVGGGGVIPRRRTWCRAISRISPGLGRGDGRAPRLSTSPSASARCSRDELIPVKALHLQGRITDEIRLPLTRMTAPNLEKLTLAMKDHGLL